MLKEMTVDQVRVLANVAGVSLQLAHDTLKQYGILIGDDGWTIV